MKNGDHWLDATEDQLLIASDGMRGDRLGLRVAINQETIVVSAPFADAFGTDSGAGYVYVRDQGAWVEKGRLSPDENLPNERMATVAVQGSRIVIGSANG